MKNYFQFVFKLNANNDNLYRFCVSISFLICHRNVGTFHVIHNTCCANFLNIANTKTNGDTISNATEKINKSVLVTFLKFI